MSALGLGRGWTKCSAVFYVDFGDSDPSCGPVKHLFTSDASAFLDLNSSYLAFSVPMTSGSIDFQSSFSTSVISVLFFFSFFFYTT